METSYSKVIGYLQQKGLRHEVHRFPSGAAMIDVWVNDRFTYCLQCYPGEFGFSEIDENEYPPFTTIPDEGFATEDGLMDRLKRVFG